jgi:hypothetical protein
MTEATQADPDDTTSSAPRDAAYWAPRVAGLTVDELPAGALNLNVEGRLLSGPIQGFGRMWRKRHWVRLEGADVEPAEVIRVWKQHFAEFWPAGSRFYGRSPGSHRARSPSSTRPYREFRGSPRA